MLKQHINDTLECLLTVSQLETTRSHTGQPCDEAAAEHNSDAEDASAEDVDESRNELDALGDVNVGGPVTASLQPAALKRPKLPKHVLPVLPTNRADCAQQLELVDFGERVKSVACSSSLVQQLVLALMKLGRRHTRLQVRSSGRARATRSVE